MDITVRPMQEADFPVLAGWAGMLIRARRLAARRRDTRVKPHSGTSTLKSQLYALVIASASVLGSACGDAIEPAERSILFLWDHGGQYLGGHGRVACEPDAHLGPDDSPQRQVDGRAGFRYVPHGRLRNAGEGCGGPVVHGVLRTHRSWRRQQLSIDRDPQRHLEQPSTDARAVAELIPDLYIELHADRAEFVTLSSYDLEGLAPFLEAVDSLGSLLERRVKDTPTETEYVTAIRTAAASSQLYSDGPKGFPEVKDLVDFLDSLEVRLDEGDDSTRARVATLRERALDPAFRLANAFNTAPPDERNVDRSNGRPSCCRPFKVRPTWTYTGTSSAPATGVIFSTNTIADSRHRVHSLRLVLPIPTNTGSAWTE